MPKLAIPLTDKEIKNAKPREKTYSLPDGGGMFLEITTNGVKTWRMAFRQQNGKKNNLTFGRYPEVSLLEARTKRAVAKRQISEGIDPAKDREEKKRNANAAAANTFEVIARAWHKNRAESSWQPQTADQNIKALEKDLFPVIGKLPIAQINTRRIQFRSATTC